MFGGVESECLPPGHWSCGRRSGRGAGFACLVGLGARLSLTGRRSGRGAGPAVVLMFVGVGHLAESES